MHDLAERVCIGYTFSMRSKESSVRDLLNALLEDAQARGEFLGGFRVRTGKDAHLLHVRHDDSHEECEGLPP